jgi:hypothetical protein
MMLTHNYQPRTQQYPFYNSQQLQQLQQQLDIDSLDTDSIASSPLSTATNFQTTPLSTSFDAPRRLNNNFKFPATATSQQQSTFDAGDSQSLSQVPDLMPSESWLLPSQQPPTATRAAHHLGHNRESSLSSLGSNGPASPYNANTSNPHIAITDSSSDAYHDMSGGDSNYSYQMGKPMSDHFYATLQSLNGHGSGMTDMFSDGLPNLTTQQPQQQKARSGRGLLPAADLSIGSVTRSRPASVASSTVGGDSPATPSFHEPEEDVRRRKNGEQPELPAQLQRYLHTLDGDEDYSSLYFDTVFSNSLPPKLDRTMTDVYGDELFNPNFTITSASPPPQTHLAMSPSNELFTQALKAANSQHLSAVHSPVSASSRNQSPFRHGSPLAPSSNDFSQQGTQIHLHSAQQIREKQKQERDSKALQQIAHNASQQQQGTPSTISPKDAMLEFNDSDDASNFPLFPPQETNNFNLNQLNKAMPQPSQTFQSTAPMQSAFNFNMPTNMQLPQQYPFVAQSRQQQQQQQQQQITPSVSSFSRVSSADTTRSDMSEVVAQRPARTNADGGTYTCTYHGCTLRFETPALLQKHKREGHRQANALNNVRVPVVTSPGVPDSLLGSQAGPHRCDRINPSTGKSCNTVFSRPYDLTRHEDTIHNARKQKVRCNLCTEEKTFSRADALTRHYRVCHPDVEFPGKHRRRGGSTA